MLIPLEKVLKINSLINIIGLDSVEIKEPDLGWEFKLKPNEIRDDGKFGKFFIRRGANIDYFHKEYSIINLQNYSSALLEIAIIQMEKKCAEIIEKKASASKLPDISFYLKKYYELS